MVGTPLSKQHGISGPKIKRNDTRNRRKKYGTTEIKVPRSINGNRFSHLNTKQLKYCKV
jgi:hypothetical protein